MRSSRAMPISATSEDTFRDVKFRPYKMTKTARRFHASQAFVKGIRGPVGSGKSVMCCMEVLSRAIEQPPGPDRVRRSRWCFVRNTYSELLSTTLKTWSEWVPPEVCPVTMSAPISGRMVVNLADGTIVDLEIIFLSMDRAEDAAKMKSLDLTGVWLNEAGELDKAALDIATTRVGRFPAKIAGGGGWSGIIMDTNPPDTSSWWYRLAEETKPDNYAFFTQPPALIKTVTKARDGNELVHWSQHPDAENIDGHRLGVDYYLRMIPGKTDEWIKVFVLGEYGTSLQGKPVFPEYQDSVHCSKGPIIPAKSLPLFLGFDFGLNACCVIGQMDAAGKLRIIDEAVSEKGIQGFVREVLRPKLANEYPGYTYVSVGDPAGVSRSQTDETTCYQILEEEGFYAIPAPTNNFVARREAVVYFLTRGAFELSPKCQVLRRGFIKEYRYRKMRLAGVDRWSEVPEKNEFSHPHDALQYLCLYLKTFGMTTGGVQATMPSAPSRDKPRLSMWI